MFEKCHITWFSKIVQKLCKHRFCVTLYEESFKEIHQKVSNFINF